MGEINNRVQGFQTDVPARRVEWRSLAVFGFDLVCVVLAWLGSFQLSFNFSPPAGYGDVTWKALALLLPAEAVLFRLAGLYRGIWFFSSLPDLERILKSVGLSALLLFMVATVMAPVPAIPLAILMLYPLLLIIMMGGGRALYRMWKEHRLYGSINVGGKPVLVLGAGRTGASLVQALSRSREWRVVGLLDDDPTKQQREVLGRRVLGSLNELPYWAGRLNVHHAILAMPSVPDELRRRISTFCLQASVTAYTVPSTEQLLLEKDRLDHVRPIDLDDLLGRSPVHFDTPETRALISGKVVMVTGAGGSIGSELCRQIAQLDPAQMLLLDNSEFALYTLTDEMSRDFPEVALVPLAADVKDAQWVNDIFRRHTPAIVFHAAAYKHVPLMEDHNAWQAVRNNVLGTYVTAMAALRTEVPRFVLVSTDKAVNPTNVMGASKRMAEMVCQALQGTGTTRFEIVRFGNVLGSTGSVVPKFQAQIRKGGPLTVTHPEITRFFMSIPEATQLVLQAAAMGEGGEIFVLDMGKPVRIADLARDMIRLSGRSEREIPIVYTGLRPGEKLYEELLSDDEHTRPTHHPKLRIAKARAVASDWLDEMLEWLRSPLPRADAEVRRDLRRWVSEYQPTIPPTLKPIPVAQKSSQAS